MAELIGPVLPSRDDLLLVFDSAGRPAQKKIRIVVNGLRSESSITELCRRDGIAEVSDTAKEFLEAGKRRLAGDMARAATSSEVTDLRREARALKEVVAEQALELRLLRKSMIADGGGCSRHTT